MQGNISATGSFDKRHPYQESCTGYEDIRTVGKTKSQLPPTAYPAANANNQPSAASLKSKYLNKQTRMGSAQQQEADS